MEYLGIALTLFGGIFLLITIISYFTMQKEIINPNCPQDVKDVAYNKKWGKIYLTIYSIAVVFGVMLLLI
jgi:cbb3-type cytochrome oxidase subunit 3